MKNITANPQYCKSYKTYERADKEIKAHIESICEGLEQDTKLHNLLSYVWYTIVATPCGRFAPVFLLKSDQMPYMHDYIGTGSKGFKIVNQG